MSSLLYRIDVTLPKDVFVVVIVFPGGQNKRWDANFSRPSK